jgi:hypothetical protein
MDGESERTLKYDHQRPAMSKKLGRTTVWTKAKAVESATASGFCNCSINSEEG